MIFIRLWHEKLLPLLPSAQLNGQHRECCALRGLGWGKKHSTVNYVFNYNRSKLYQYHMIVIAERERRGYKVDDAWRNPLYRGKISSPDDTYEMETITGTIYPKHDDKYLAECILNLKGKGITI